MFCLFLIDTTVFNVLQWQHMYCTVAYIICTNLIFYYVTLLTVHSQITVVIDFCDTHNNLLENMHTFPSVQ